MTDDKPLDVERFLAEEVKNTFETIGLVFYVLTFLMALFVIFVGYLVFKGIIATTWIVWIALFGLIALIFYQSSQLEQQRKYINKIHKFYYQTQIEYQKKLDELTNENKKGQE